MFQEAARASHILRQADKTGEVGGQRDLDVQSLIDALKQSKQEMEIARRQFDTVTEPLLIDHIVFRLGAAERQFNYLIQLARRWNVSVPGICREWFDPI